LRIAAAVLLLTWLLCLAASTVLASDTPITIVPHEAHQTLH